MRYSDSEPITNLTAALENQFNMKSNKEEDAERVNGESKASVNQVIPFTNNFERSTKENDANSITSASIIKDNQVNMSGCSLNNSQINNKKPSKKKMLASSDSDFFSLLRYNSEKLRRINCFSTSTNNNGNKPKNMIYALSDSDFLIGVNDKNKNLNLNNERKSQQAIVNKSDIFNFLINQKSIDYKNLLDSNFAQNNQQNKVDVASKKHFDNPDLFSMEKLKAVFGEAATESEKQKIIESMSLSDDVTAVKDLIQKKETVSLPPTVNANTDFANVMLNNSQSIDTVLLNIKNSAADKLSANNLMPPFDFSKNLPIPPMKPPANDETAANNLLQNNNNIKSADSLRKLNDSTNTPDVHEAIAQDCTNCYDTMNPVSLDDKNITRRKRTPSTVTYNVNVINFQADDDPDRLSVSGGGYGKRSNSSTSKSLSVVRLPSANIFTVKL